MIADLANFLLAGLGGLALIVVILLFSFILLANNLRATRDTTRAFNMTLIRVVFRKNGGQPLKGFAPELVVLTEKLFKILSSLRSRGRFIDYFIYEEPYVTFEIMNEGHGVEFYIAFPRKIEQQITKYIYSIFSDAEVIKVPGTNPFQEGQRVVFSTLALRKPATTPLPTFDRFSGEPLAELFKVLETVEHSQSGAVQFVIRPAPLDWNERALREVESSAIGRQAGVVYDVSLQEQRRDKASRPVFYTNIRLMATASSERAAYRLLHALEESFRSMTDRDFNQLDAQDLTIEDASFNFTLRLFNSAVALALSTRELATFYHFKYTRDSGAETSSRVLPDFTAAERPDIALGTLVEQPAQTVRFASLVDRFSHVYTVGQTGTGKSSLFREMVRQDMEQGRGVAVIDPHGDLIDSILEVVPAERLEDVVLFDPSDTEYPCGLNMLEFQAERERDLIVQEIIVIFQKLFPAEFVGPVFEHNMRNALLTLMADQAHPGTLVEIPRLFTDELFAKRYVTRLTDPIVKDFWLRERSRISLEDQGETLQYIVSKLGRFIEDRLMRDILGQRHSSFSVANILSEGKILLVNLAKGKIGELNAALMGLIIVSRIQIAAFDQARVSAEKRNDFFLYIDEFQNFTTDTAMAIFSEARKYRLGLNITHQFIDQLSERTRSAILGNVGTMIAFRVGPRDAQYLAAEFAPLGTPYALLNMDNYQAMAKLMVQGKRTAPFLMATNRPAAGDRAVAEAVRKSSRLRYGRPRASVEAEINRNLQ